MKEKLDQSYPDHIATVMHRCNQALAAGGYDHMLVASGAPHWIFLDDAPYPFKVNAQFKVWVPVTTVPNCFIWYTPDKQPVMLFYQPRDYWHVVADAPDDFWSRHFDIRLIRDVTDVRAHLPDNMSSVAFIGEPGDVPDDLPVGDINPESVLNHLHYHRAPKTKYELHCMREASRLGVLAHRAAEDCFMNGGSEYDIHLAYQQACGLTEQELPYSNIIAFSRHGAVLHYTNLERLRPADTVSFLIDAGAQYNGYASDITRTYSANGGEFGEIIARFDSMQRALCSQVAPGVSYGDLHVAAHRAISGILKDIGVITAEADTAVESGLSAAFFPHGLGHYIGLQVHDVGGFMADDTGDTIDKPDGHPYLRLTRTLAENNVLTIEPGMYFIDMLLDEVREDQRKDMVNWDRLAELHPYGGIRIEDDVRVTAIGHENLTRDAYAATA